MNMYVLALIVVPIIFAVLYALNDNKAYYKLLSYVLCIFGTAFSILLALKGPVKFTISGSTFSIIEGIILIVEILILVFLFWVSIKHRRKNVLLLTFIQAIIFVYSSFFMEKHHEVTLNVDNFSIIMLLLVNIIGTLIVVFANGYITEYEHHRHMKSKQKQFYVIICIFISAMNGLVASDALTWIYFFWEITTLASFLLIGYNADEEAYNSAFRALYINLIGGICFALGNILFAKQLGITTLTGIINHGKLTGIYIVPVFLLCIAGFAKSAQMPFQSWLLGAMVAPTPVSALLHSSTMVKAGVYLIVKLSPAYAGTKLGTAIALYGGFTFLLCSAIAISQRNAKRVLAYSTIANLGLIICSAGMGSSLAISSAIILIIFHAVSKALLFLCTGQIEHTIGSRDIEDMQGLIHKAPALALITAFGAISMILPPFGVLITKLISIEASANNPFIAIFLILGSAATTLYYVKWIGNLVSYPENKLTKNGKVDINIYLPLVVLSILVLLSSIFVSPIYNNMVSPEINVLLPHAAKGLSVSRAVITSQIGGFNNEIVFIVLGLVVLIALAIKGSLITKADRKNIYMCGENNIEDETMFRSANGTYDKATVGNLYLSHILDEKTLTLLGTIVSVSLILIVILGGLS